LLTVYNQEKSSPDDDFFLATRGCKIAIINKGYSHVAQPEKSKKNPEFDPLLLGTGWTAEDLKKPQVLLESTAGDSHRRRAIGPGGGRRFDIHRYSGTNSGYRGF